MYTRNNGHQIPVYLFNVAQKRKSRRLTCFISICKESWKRCLSMWSESRGPKLRRGPHTDICPSISNDILPIIYGIYSWPLLFILASLDLDKGQLRRLSNHFPLIFYLLIDSLGQWMFPLKIHELLTLLQHGSTYCHLALSSIAANVYWYFLMTLSWFEFTLHGDTFDKVQSTSKHYKSTDSRYHIMTSHTLWQI